MTTCDLDLSPGGPDKSGHKESSLFGINLHDIWSLKLLADPFCLLQVVDKHVLHPNMVTVGILGKIEEPRHEKASFPGFRQFSGCTATEDSYRLEISDL